MNVKRISSAILVLSFVGLSHLIVGCTSQAEKDAAAKANADIARIRELKEIEEARAKAADQSAEEFSAALRKGAAAPMREFKTKP